MNLAAKALKAELDPKPSRLFKAVQIRYGKIKLMKCLHGIKNAERKKLAVINALIQTMDSRYESEPNC